MSVMPYDPTKARAKRLRQVLLAAVMCLLIIWFAGRAVSLIAGFVRGLAVMLQKMLS